MAHDKGEVKEIKAIASLGSFGYYKGGNPGKNSNRGTREELGDAREAGVYVGRGIDTNSERSELWFLSGYLEKIG